VTTCRCGGKTFKVKPKKAAAKKAPAKKAAPQKIKPQKEPSKRSANLSKKATAAAKKAASPCRCS